MAAPTPRLRKLTYERDGYSCASCGSRSGLEFQHRQATGMGGSRIPPSFVQGLTACARCNPRYETDLQRKALNHGWKVRRWVEHAGRVPVFYVLEREWFRLTLDGTRVVVSRDVAMEMMSEVYGNDWHGTYGLLGVSD